METNTVLVVGLGEIGKPLRRILALTYPTVGKDKEPVEWEGDVDVMHICYPYNEKFVSSVVEYQRKFKPGVTVINSTVPPPTTELVAQETGHAIAYSPVRGRHTTMERDLLRYRKYVRGEDSHAHKLTVAHFRHAGFVTDESVTTPRALELAKLMETSYSALLIAWAQEIKRYASAFCSTNEEVLALTEEPEYLPDYIFHPGRIGGHCLMQNLNLLHQLRSSDFIQAIRRSNNATKDDGKRHRPRRFK